MRFDPFPELRAQRERVGETQSQFAERFGVNQSTIHRWETLGVARIKATRVLIEAVLKDVRRLPDRETPTREAAA